jgi:ATP-dependent Clp protease protease subunit
VAWHRHCYMLRTLHIAFLCCFVATFEATIRADETEQNPAERMAPSAQGGKSVTVLDEPDVREERNRISLQNQLHDELLRQELQTANSELQRTKAEIELRQAKVDRELIGPRTEIERARVEVEQISTRLALENAQLQATMQKQLASLRAQREEAELQASLAVAEYTRRNHEYKTKELAWNEHFGELSAKVTERQKQTEADNYVDQKPACLKEPLQADGKLIISDRRIPMNGPITGDLADFVCGRIDFYNNKSTEYPIFIVIDESPGGSVMAGYKILKTMQSSSAPVYVVVKSYAASMAAAICTLAQRSFAYPNAVILHHQISTGSRGNLAAQREGVKLLEEWWQRLAGPIATKMGITIEELSRKMYAHSSTGDWQEFADQAVKLKWVDAVVERCSETALLKSPDNIAGGTGEFATRATVSAPATLPRLNPLDCYYLYNPDGFYQVK